MTTVFLHCAATVATADTGGDRYDLGDWQGLPHEGSAEHVVLAHLASHLPMVELRRFVHRACWLLAPGGTWELLTRDPDAAAARGERPWPGEQRDGEYFRPLRHYLELARLFPCTLRTPEQLAGTDLLRVCGERTTDTVTVHGPRPADSDPQSAAARAETRYGVASRYRRFDRLEEPEIVDDLLYGMSRLDLGNRELGRRQRVLALGVNDGRELALIDEVLPPDAAAPELWGVDVAPSAIEAARQRFPEQSDHFVCADLAQLDSLELPQCDAALLLGVLQCTTVDRDALLKSLLDLLAPRCALLVSIPNCHFGAHDILRRPLRRDDPRHDRSLVWKDLRFLARWCYRSGFGHVETFGTYDAFLLARRK